MSRPDFDPGESISREQLLAQIDTRLEVLRPLVDEYEQLSRARAVLGEDAAGSAARGGVAGRGSARPARGNRRAPRGANREAILRLAGERPGITVAEIASETGIGKPTVHSTVYALTRRGELQRAGDGVELAGSQAPAPRPARRSASSRRASARRAGRGRSARRGSRARRAAGAPGTRRATPADPAAAAGGAPADLSADPEPDAPDAAAPSDQ